MEPDAILSTPSSTSLSRIPAGGAPGEAGAGSSTADNALSSDFETFIRMLTVQMRNQDPLNPIESADFAVQLATFSTVEQQVRTNDLLTSLGDQLGAQNLSQLSGWVGMEARAHMPVEFDGAPVRLTTETDSLADSGRIVVRDARGEIVQSLDVPSGRQVMEWVGVSDSGAVLPAGRYDLTLESLSQDSVVASAPVEIHGKIAEARNAGGRAVLVMQSGQEVLSQDIIALRAPE